MEVRPVTMDSNGIAQGGGSGYGFAVMPAVPPQDLANLALASPVAQYLRPGSFPVLVRPKGEAPFYVYSAAVFRRERPYGELFLEGGRAGECWQVVTLGKPQEDFFVPDNGPKRCILVPAADNASSPYAGGVDLSTSAASLGSSNNWLVLRPNMKELQFAFSVASGTVTFYVQTAAGQIATFDTLDLSTATTYRASFPGTRLWVRCSTSCRAYVDALCEVG